MKITAGNNCNMDRVILEEYVEGFLEPIERLLVEEHVKKCVICRKEFTELKLISWELKNAAQSKVLFPPKLDSLGEELVYSFCKGPITLGERVSKTLAISRRAVSSVFGFARKLPIYNEPKKDMQRNSLLKSISTHVLQLMKAKNKKPGLSIKSLTNLLGGMR